VRHRDEDASSRISEMSSTGSDEADKARRMECMTPSLPIDTYRTVSIRGWSTYQTPLSRNSAFSFQQQCRWHAADRPTGRSSHWARVPNGVDRTAKVANAPPVQGLDAPIFVASSNRTFFRKATEPSRPLGHVHGPEVLPLVVAQVSMEGIRSGDLWVVGVPTRNKAEPSRALRFRGLRPLM
jgi:hypothetical protein